MILDLFFPNRCLDCHIIINSEEVICDACLSNIDFTHIDYFSNNRLLQKCRTLFPTENAFALMQFEKDNLARKILHHLKYGSREKIGRNLAKWTIERINFNEQSPQLITTIPLHPSKQKERGYNQLHLFANTLSLFYNINVDHHLLKRNTSNKAQAKRKKEERGNYQNQFSITKELQNTHVLIIDDVFTTGNTMSHAAWEILQDKTNKVSVIVMAID